MAARVITPDELKAACQVLADRKNLTMSQGEGGTITLMPGDIIFSLEAGSPRMACADANAEIGAELHGKLREILMDMAESSQEPVISPKTDDRSTRRPITQPPRQNGATGAQAKPTAIIPVRDAQVQDLSFEDIKSFLCPAASDKDAYMFLQLCKARNLNPFTNEAYLIPYKDKNDNIKCSIVVGKEAFMRKAELHPQFKGFKAGIIVSKDDDLIYREGTFTRKGETLEGGWAEVYRADRDFPVRSEVALAEYHKHNRQWNEMTGTMIRKVAIVQSMREAFSTDLAGCYDADEMRMDIDLDPANEIETEGRRAEA